MKVLVACEFSGVVRRAFTARGHEAISCDLLPAEDNSPAHIQDDVLNILEEGWDLMIAHPPCTYLAAAGLHLNAYDSARTKRTHEAILFVLNLMGEGTVYNPIPRIALENPVGRISTAYRKPDQIIHPWQFGHPESKRTCLWFKGLPYLQPTNVLTPTEFQFNGRPLWENQTPSGRDKLGPGRDRQTSRSRTYLGIAEAMADQWG